MRGMNHRKVSLLACLATIYCFPGLVRGLDWTSQTVESGYAGWGSSVCVNSAGRPIISYNALVPADDKSYLRVATWTGGYWDVQTVEPIVEGWANGTSLALDDYGHSHVAYSIGLAGEGLRYAAWDGASWQLMTVDGVAGVRLIDPKLGLDSTGNARIVYSDTTGGHKYAVRNGGFWDVGAAGQAGTYAFPVAGLAIDENDVTHVAGPNPSALAYAARDASGWRGENGIAGTTIRASVAVDGEGNPHIAHVSHTDDILRYTHWSGMGWETVIVDSNLHWQGGASLVMDPWGRPRIGYLKHDENRVGGTYPYYAAWNGQDWDVERVPAERAHGSYGLSMAIDDLGGVHLTYYGESAGTSGDGLRYSYGVAEPSTFVLLYMGAVGLLAYAWRRRRR